MSPPDDTDLLAAEYVLGTLDGEERSGAAQRAAADPAFARAVEDWEAKLSPLSELSPDVAPPASLLQAIETRLFGQRPGAAPAKLRFWRGATFAFAALAAALIVWIAVTGPTTSASPSRLVAVLQREAGAPAMVLDVDLKTRRLFVRSIAPATPPGKAYELWLIDPAIGAPRPLGLVSSDAASDTSLVSYDSAVIAGATYAVTLEPAGGSPDRRPSGAPILSGRLVSTP